MQALPANLRYSDTHNWVQEIEAGLLRVGITDFAQSELGDVVFVELPETRRRYMRGNTCAVVESVKSAADIYCPVSGVVVEVNSHLCDRPDLLNTDPYDKGWLFVIDPDDSSEFATLQDVKGYAALINQ